MRYWPDRRINPPVLALAAPAAGGDRARLLRLPGWPGPHWLPSLRRPQLLVAIPIVLLALVCAIAAPVLAPADPMTQDFAHALAPPSRQHLLGTDEFGRDILSRVIFGARISLGVSLVAVALAVAIGGPLGLVSGYAGGVVDSIAMRIVDAVLAFPGLIIVIALATALGPAQQSVIIALAIAAAPSFARMTRALTLRARGQEYVLAAGAVGQTPLRIATRHILPNLLLPLVVQLSLALGATMIAEASLSYLGLAAQPNEPSWGRMVLHGRMVLETHPYVTVIPLLVLSVVILGFNLLGDGLSDLLDPQLRRMA